MKSLSLGKLFNIEIELHWTFVFLAVFIVGILLLFMPESFLPITTLFFFLFLSVFFHELFHSLIAMQKGSAVKKIILLPIGGLSVTEEMPENPKDEFLIAVAGPAFNFLIVFLILLLISILPLPFPREIFSGGFSSELLQQAIMTYPLFALFWVNLILGAFNLFLPAFPLDGGRVFRAVLALKFNYNKATQLASKVSMVFAIFLFLIGLFGGGLIVLIIAVFIFIGAQQEAQIVAVKETMKGISFQKLIQKKPKTLPENTTVAEAINEMISLQKTHFLVKKTAGFAIISLEEIVQKKHSLNTPIKRIATEVPAVQKNIKPEKLMEKFLVKGYPLIPILSGKKFIGIIEFLELEKVYNLKKLSKTYNLRITSNKKPISKKTPKKKKKSQKQRIKKSKK